MSNILELIGVSKSFVQGPFTLKILNNISLSISKGEIVGLVGASGSGKSSLLHIAGLLDNPSVGEVYINGHNYSKCSDHTKTIARRNHIGFIYQFHHLLSDFTALENTMMPMLINGVGVSRAKKNAMKLLEKVNLEDRFNHLPGELSGGQQQRVAIIRALANNPKLLLADEPTGNLDSKTSESVFELLLQEVQDRELSALIVTHNMELAKKMHKLYVMKDGMIFNLR